MAEAIAMWLYQDIVEIYTRGNFTFAWDKLAAIREFKEQMGTNM